MYSTISKDKIDKHVIDFIYKLFVLLVASMEAPRPTGHSLTGCRVKYPSLVLKQRTLKKERWSYGTAHAKLQTLVCTDTYILTQKHACAHTRTHTHEVIIGHSSNQFHS